MKHKKQLVAHSAALPPLTRYRMLLQKIFYRLILWLEGYPRLHGLVKNSAVFVVILILWQFVSSLKIYPDYLFPSPGEVVTTFFWSLSSGALLKHIGDSLVRIFLGSMAGLVIGLPLGLLMGGSRAATSFFNPVVVFFQAIPGLAWIPLVILWFGIGYKAVTFIIFSSVFFPIVFNTSVGIRGIDPSMTDAALTLGASRWVLITDLYLPGAMANIVTGIRVGVAYGWRALVGGEMMAAGSGLGRMIFDARMWLETDVVVVGIIMLGTIWLLMDRLILKPLETATIEKWGTVRV